MPQESDYKVTTSLWQSKFEGKDWLYGKARVGDGHVRVRIYKPKQKTKNDEVAYLAMHKGDVEALLRGDFSDPRSDEERKDPDHQPSEDWDIGF